MRYNCPSWPGKDCMKHTVDKKPHAASPSSHGRRKKNLPSKSKQKLTTVLLSKISYSKLKGPTYSKMHLNVVCFHLFSLMGAFWVPNFAIYNLLHLHWPPLTTHQFLFVSVAIGVLRTSIRLCLADVWRQRQTIYQSRLKKLHLGWLVCAH